MSKLFIIAITPQKTGECMQEKIRNILSSNIGLDISSEFGYCEPLLAYYPNTDQIYNITDAGSDNCEMFLLPDNCFYSGKTNPIPFRNRMEQLSMTFIALRFFSKSIEVFIGDSGTEYYEFTAIQVSAELFPEAANRLINNTGFPQIHFIIQ